MGNVQGGDRSSFHGKRDHSTGGGSYLQSPPGNAFWQPEDDPSYGNTMNANYLTTDSGGLQIRLSCDDYSSGQRTANIVKFDEMLEFPVVLKYTGNAKAVCVTGSWDGWRKKIPMVRSANDFTTIINLPEGRHEFKFTVDGRTICDHNFPKSGDNNLILVDKADFEVFDALDRDSQAVAASRNIDSGGSQRQSLTAPSAGGNGSDTSDTESSNETNGADISQYGQIIPPRRAFDKSHAPPALPPHLLQVILNKDTPISCDPNVLPEPNHVMLNHLYALSIKDDVMVLSATHRYRKKYVTTLLYKPI